MAVNNLFDTKRSREINEALRTGRPVFRRGARPGLSEGRAIDIEETDIVSEVPTPHAGARKLSPDQQARLDSMLLMAVKVSDIGAAKAALAVGADVNARDTFSAAATLVDGMVSRSCGNTALMIAAEGGDKPMVELLLKYGADVNLDFNYGSCPFPTALSRARDRRHTAIIDLLKRHGAVE